MKFSTLHIGATFLVLSGMSCSKSADEERMASLKKLVQTGPFVDVQPHDLVWDYRQNSVSADDKYKGKALRIGVTVDRVGQDKDGAPVIFMHGYHEDSAHENITCAWGGTRDSAAGLQSGPKVLMRGVGASTLDGSPLLVFCEEDH